MSPALAMTEAIRKKVSQASLGAIINQHEVLDSAWVHRDKGHQSLTTENGLATMLFPNDRMSYSYSYCCCQP